jgi:2-keto-4-pentenoate hydratase/2-oxohepta-3-ene-1,7-dioic acid hydratase in catechol pathway
MTVSILHTADAWWVKVADAAVRIDTAATTTAALLADRTAIEAALETGGASPDTVALDTLELVSPVTKPCRVIAQMTNFESHVKDAGMDPASVPLTFFRKASGSINGPFDEIVNLRTSTS